MISILGGLLGFVVGGCIFYLGYRLGQRGAVPAPLSVEEKARKRFEEDQAAFKDLMSYNPEVAYGLARLGEESDA